MEICGCIGCNIKVAVKIVFGTTIFKVTGFWVIAFVVCIPLIKGLSNTVNYIPFKLTKLYIQN